MMMVGVIIGGFLFYVTAEAASSKLAQLLGKKGIPYELQHVPMFLVLFLTTGVIYKQSMLAPMAEMVLKFLLLYSAVGVVFLLFLALVRQLHYQSYIFLLNWLKRE
ncbi:hypothetical protein [Bacillus sp. 165]|uniref:hypothetical protein n=1 Tax=Bacillus sp. 165 TaxID=1529117 RepID=UPI001ADAAFA7|nr:hypothetical protein [Bacillus sp. 165]MBO9129330.1 hypothetical protein [Bacillus sp. 165]